MSDSRKDPNTDCAFDFSAYPPNTVFHERRMGKDRRQAPQERERPPRKERRRRIDPTTFEKQYTDDEMEFMNAMQRFKERTGKSFPSYGEVIKVAMTLGYRKVVDAESANEDGEDSLSSIFSNDEDDD